MHIVCFVLILLGGGLTISSAWRYNKAARRIMHLANNTRPYLHLTSISSQVLLWLLVFGYVVGAFYILLHTDVDPIFYFISLIVLINAIFIFVMVQKHQTDSIFIFIMLQKHRTDNETLINNQQEKQRALDEMEKYNLQLRNQIEEQLNEVKHQDRLLRTVNDTAAILLASNVNEFEYSLWESFGMLAESVNVDRVYIWKNFQKDDKLFCTQVYEWSEDVSPQQDTEFTVNIPYDENIPGWEETLSSGRSVNGLVRNLSQEEQNQLSPQGIISILVVPVFLKEHFWGFVGFDDCHSERNFTKAEEAILRSGSLLFANALIRNEMTQNLMQAREDALASTKSKSEFLANMSHEIRTPINAITGMTAIASNSNDIDAIHNCLKKVDTASKQLLGIINYILDMSKIEANKMELAAEPFNLFSVVQNVESIIEIRATEKRQSFSVNINPDIPYVVVGDDLRLSQILINLLSNAVKFTPEEGEISLSLRLLSSNNNLHCFEALIKDNGIGISKEQQSRLFSSFEQAEKGTSKRYGGTGLGLAISKRLANLMGGDITLESEYGKGSSFAVTFCLGVGKTDTIDSTEKANDCDFSGKTFLLVEDIEINREIVLALLEDSSVTIECAENGQEAVNIFKANSQKYDLIFMDIQMPIMDGYTATKAIRDSGVPHAQTVPILAMTANAFAEDVEQCRAVGMNDHIAKPIDIDLLIRKINNLLQHSHSI